MKFYGKNILRGISLLLIAVMMLSVLPSCSITIENESKEATEAMKNKEIEKTIASSQLQYPAQNDTFFYNVYTDYVKITKYLGSGGEVNVPSELEGLPVYAIGKETFKETEVTTVTIEEGIYSIGESCFENCALLEFVQMPDSLVKIGQYAFRQCASLKEITFPRQVYEIPYYACYECPSLQTVTILSEKANTRVGGSAFIRCSSLQTVYISEFVTEIISDSFNDVHPDITFYGPAGCAAASFCAERFFNYVVEVEKVEDVEPGEGSEEGSDGERSSEQEQSSDGSLASLIVIGIVFVALVATGVTLLIIKRRRYRF